MLTDSETPDKVNELYEAIANHRNALTGGLKGTKDELLTLDDYIAKTGTDDEFIFGLIKYRLENKTKMTPEQISEFMKREYSTASKVRQEKQEQEIVHEKAETIKDEIGDEFQPKTEADKKVEEQVETMWQQQFQSWDRNVMTLPNGAKRKQEAAKVMSDIVRQQEQQEKQTQEQLEEQENHGTR